MQQGLEHRRGHIARTADAGVQTHVLSSTAPIMGNGVAIIPVKFPVTFTEKPAFVTGWDLGQLQGSNDADAIFPGVQLGVKDWEVEERLPGIFIYKGATLVVTVENSPGVIYVHWQITGYAYRNPIRGFE